MKQSFIKGATIASLGVIITKALGVLYAIPFSSMIGEGGASLYFYGYNVYIVFINISVAGIPFGISKLVSQYSSLNKYKSIDRAFEVSKKLMILISIITFILMFTFADFYAAYVVKDLSPKELSELSYTIKDIVWAIRSVSFALLFVPMLAFSRGFLQGFQEMATTAKSQIIEQIARIVFLLGGVYLCLYVFDLGVINAVYAALFAAFFGAIFGFIVVNKRAKKQKEFVKSNYDLDKHKVDSYKVVLKKIFLYSIPFILLSLMLQTYNQVNTMTIKNILSEIGYSGKESESIFNAITGWGPKLNRLVFSFTVGFNTALIPTISSDFARGDLELVKMKTEKSFQLILLLVFYLSVFCSVFSAEIFPFFFDTNVLGPMIFKISVFTTLFHSFMYVTSVILQASNHAYISILTMFVGVLVKVILNKPMVLLLNAAGIEASYGFVFSTIIGFFVTIILNIILINKFLDLNLKVLGQRLMKLLLIVAVTFGLTIALKYIIPYSPSSKFEIIIYCGLFGAFSLSIYLYLGFYSKLIQRALGEEIIEKAKQKFKNKLRLN